jgi:uncharacterized protein with GYD domain
MAGTDDYTKYALLAQLQTTEIQNPLELASMWGKITNECEEIGADVEDSYAVLGQFDFLIILDAPSRGNVLKAALIMERYGLDVQTMGILSIDQFADIVEDM